MLPGGLGMKAAMGASWASAAAGAIYGNPMGRRMAIGAGIGAGYGALSRNNTMAGGALYGAGIGGGYSVARKTGTMSLARQVWGGGGKFTNRLKVAARVQGQLAKRYIGNNITRTMGQIRGL